MGFEVPRLKIWLVTNTSLFSFYIFFSFLAQLSYLSHCANPMSSWAPPSQVKFFKPMSTSSLLSVTAENKVCTLSRNVTKSQKTKLFCIRELADSTLWLLNQNSQLLSARRGLQLSPLRKFRLIGMQSLIDFSYWNSNLRSINLAKNRELHLDWAKF